MQLKRISLFVPAAFLACAAIAGCHRSQTFSSAPTLAEAGMVLSGGRLVLPAVPGNPGAAYFTIVNQGHAAAIVTGVSVDGAGKAEMHETIGETMQPLPAVSIRAGGSAIFAPGGKHVMAFSLAPRLVPAGTTQITLSFSDGSKLSAPLRIEGAGASQAPDDMAGMKM